MKPKGALADPQIRQLLAEGFTGGIPQRGLRPESFEHLRAGGAVHGGGVTLKIRADGGVQIIDGRHRLTLARERGDASFTGRILVEGRRGGITRDVAAVVVPLMPAAQGGEQTVRARAVPKKRR